jgi:hypothetical protein
VLPPCSGCSEDGGSKILYTTSWCHNPNTTTSGCVIPITDIGGPFENFVDWRQCAAVMQRVAVTIIPSCSGGGNIVVA